MRVSAIVEGRPGASLVPCLTFLSLCLWIGEVTAAQGQAPQSSPAPPGEPIEEIEVTGRSSLLSLRVDIANSETRMFSLFNELNDVREFDISCEAVMTTGSRLAERECVPVYMKRARQGNVADFLFSDLTPPHAGDVRMQGGKSLDVQGVQQSEQELWFHAQPKHREFNANFRELASQHPELAAAALDLQSKRQRLAELEERQQKASVLGRFFSGFGGKDEE